MTGVRFPASELAAAFVIFRYQECYIITFERENDNW
jgi:hypothetical protein